VKICSQHYRPGLNPACSCLSRSSTASLIRFSITLTMILPGIDKRVMSRQFMHSFGAPFFGSGMMIPSFQVVGILPVVQISLHSLVSWPIAASPPYLIISAFIPSFLVAFPFSYFVSLFLLHPLLWLLYRCPTSRFREACPKLQTAPLVLVNSAHPQSILSNVVLAHHASLWLVHCYFWLEESASLFYPPVPPQYGTKFWSLR